MENKKIKIGLIGLGTVGSGVYKTLGTFNNIEVVKIAVKNKNKKRDIPNLDESLITDDPYEVVNNPEIDIVCELIGGMEPAYDLITKAIENGKHIVTANKELLAKRGVEIFNFAEKHNKVVLYEAAIAGGIPIIMPIKTILAGNKISKIEAIINGTVTLKQIRQATLKVLMPLIKLQLLRLSRLKRESNLKTFIEKGLQKSVLKI